MVFRSAHFVARELGEKGNGCSAKPNSAFSTPLIFKAF